MVCTACGGINRFTDDLKLRQPSDDEVDELKESGLWLVINAARKAILTAKIARMAGGPADARYS